MNRTVQAIACLILGMAQYAHSQGGINGYPFDTPADPRSMALGESFVALPANPSALMYNPAGLAGLQGVSLAYSHRALNAVSPIDESMCYSLTGNVAFPFGVFGVQYNRKLYGTFPVTTAENPDGGAPLTVYSYDVALGFGTNVWDNLAIGASAKYYAMVTMSDPAYLFDFGLLYTLPPLHALASNEDSLSFGISVQNIWTQKEMTIGGYRIENDYPEYLRIGIAYALRKPPGTASGLSPFGIMVTGEYRNLFSTRGFTIERGAYWGLGIEATIFEVLTLRVGAYVEPYHGLDGEMDRPAYRYGAGLNAPLERLGCGLPLRVSINYSVEPLNQIVVPNVFNITERASLAAFSLDLQYEANLLR